MCSDAPAAPDFTPIAKVMSDYGSQMAALGEKQLAFSQKSYDDALPFYKQMFASNIEGQRLANQLARDSAADRQRFRGVESQLISEADARNRGQYQDLYAGRAAADVEQALAGARTSAARNLSRMGINPNAARFADLNNQLSMQGAAMKAGAMTNARMSADQMFENKRMNAINAGRNLPSTQLSAIGTASNVGNSNAGLFNAQDAGMYRGFAGAAQGLNSAMQGQAQIGNLMNMGYANQLNAYNANSAGLSGLGQMVGAGLSFMSSEDMKENKSPIKRGAALDAVRSMPVEGWDYKKGVEDEGRHVGTYAEAFKRETGLGDGSSINVQDALGVTMAAVKDLDAKVEALSGKKAKKMANGGRVKGRMVKGPGTGTSDSVKAINTDSGQPIRLSNGEYVLPADTVRKVGKRALDKLVAETHTPVRKAAIQKG